jgi:hypothetical protein
MAASDEVRAFFEAFERYSTQLDLDRIGQQFAETFLSADPTQVMPVPKAAFLAALPRRQALFEAAGATGVRLVSVNEQALDARHVLATTEWVVERTDAAPIRLASTFILRRANDSFVVVFYLNHQDLGEILG